MKKIFELKGAYRLILFALLWISVSFAVSSEVIARFQFYGLVSYLIILAFGLAVSIFYFLIFCLFKLILDLKEIPIVNILCFISILFNIYLFVFFRISMLFSLFSVAVLCFAAIGLILFTVLGYLILRNLFEIKDNRSTIIYFSLCLTFSLALVLTWGLL